MTQPVRKIHLIFKTHLDVGFTDLARNVVQEYFNRHIPLALQIARKMREAGSADRFVWTTGSWLIYEYLDWAKGKELKLMEEAIHHGDIVWHGLPFTTHSELMDKELFRYSLSLAKELDQRFGRKTISAKMTDVPGHTRGIVPLLADAGIQFLHIGVNGASTPPDVPPLFLWKAPDGSEVIVMYQKGSYGDLKIIPGMDEALMFAHTGDNLGPQSVEEVQQVYAGIRQRFPGVEVAASTMDIFTRNLAQIKHSLPEVTQEIGDTWIHGAGSDPKKVSQYRELLRLRKKWLDEKIWTEDSLEYHDFSRRLLLVPEHTWGLDEKIHLWNAPEFSCADLADARKKPEFKEMEESWLEQRGYIAKALETIEKKEMKDQAGDALTALEPKRPDVSVLKEVKSPAGVYAAAGFEIAFDSASGEIVSLVQKGKSKKWADRRHRLGSILFETFSREDYDRFYRQYIINKRDVGFWAVHDFTKPDMPQWVKHLQVAPVLRQFFFGKAQNSTRFVMRLEFEGEIVEKYGCPREVWVEYEIPDTGANIYCTVQWFGKSAARIAEAIWFSFEPKVEAPENWRMEKLGQTVAPLEVIRDGNCLLHGIGDGVSYHGRDGSIALRSLDAALVAPGERSLLDFNNRRPNLKKGMHFLLYDNIWGTNFPMWYDDDARFRFELQFSD